jgi:hypothetical protein
MGCYGRVIAIGLSFVGLVGLFWQQWMFFYVLGSKEQVLVTHCSDQPGAETARRPGETWCTVNGQKVRTFGSLPHRDMNEQKTAAFGQWPATTGRVAYIPTWRDVVLFSASSGGVLCGAGWIAAAAAAGRRERRRLESSESAAARP